MIDVADIKAKAGNGGDGTVSFRREKFIAKGGPDGGDGGHGGSIYFVADMNLATLMDYRSKPVREAENGTPGGKKKMFGVSGKDLYIKLPVGTLIYEGDTLVGDLHEDKQELLIARGGVGGKGNTHFKSSTNQTPLQYTKGILGEEKDLRLELKLLADVGLIGFPNAGKSTLINKLSNANAKVASYPFTTLTPNLGAVKLKNNQEIVVADLPGLISGAALGKGLGDEFLRHVERTRVLVHLIDPMDGVTDVSELVANAKKKYDEIRQELHEYSEDLIKKPEIIVINKLDITEIKENSDAIFGLFKKDNLNTIAISAVTGEGIDQLLLEKPKQDYL